VRVAGDEAGASDRALARLLGGAAVHRRPDGRPEADGGRAVSVAHAAGLVLAVAGGGAVGCDLEPVRPRRAEDWDGMLGAERSALARRIADERGEGADAAATRVWTAAEALRKAGLPPDAPLVLGAAAADGWLLLRSGGAVIGTQVLPVAGRPEPLAVAVLATAAA
jgi:enediyne polyketide synthase